MGLNTSSSSSSSLLLLLPTGSLTTLTLLGGVNLSGNPNPKLGGSLFPSVEAASVLFDTAENEIDGAGGGCIGVIGETDGKSNKESTEL